MHQHEGRTAAAVKCYRTALDINPSFADALTNLGNALSAEGQLHEAEAFCRRAVETAPNSAEAHNNLGRVLQQLGASDSAVACYEMALRLKPNYPDARWNRSLMLLQAGDFEQGWQEYEWRWQVEPLSPRALSQPSWQGEPLAGKTILLYAEQGLGDTLQFVRYAPLVKRLGATVIVECQRTLLQLLRSCPGIDHLIAYGDALPAFDYHAPLLEPAAPLQNND